MTDVNSQAAQAQRDRVFNRSVSQPIPPNAVVMVVSNGCPHCRQLMDSWNYTDKTSDGRPVVWIDTSSKEGIAKLDAIPGMSMRDYNYGGSVGVRSIPYVGDKPITGVPAQLPLTNGRATTAFSMQEAVAQVCPTLSGQQQSTESLRRGMDDLMAGKPTVPTGTCPIPGAPSR